MTGEIEVALMSLRSCALAALILLPLSSARAEYVPHPGDVLDVSVPSAPALNNRLIVDSDGNITLPFLGQVNATETPLSELGRRVRAMLTNRRIVQRADVTVSVAEYSPIYVDGDVARPGEYRYRPDMTVRSAIALAGGIDPSGGLRSSAAAQISEAQSDYGAAAIELTKQRARVARLKAELAGSDTFDASDVTAGPSVDRKVLSEIALIEARQMEADRQMRLHEQAHLERMLAAARDKAAMLEQAEGQERASFEQVVKDAAQSRELLQKGIGTNARTEDSERGLAEARAQVVDVRARLADARKEVEERARQLETFDDEHRAKALDILRDAVAEAGKAEFRLQSARERMAARSDGDTEPDVVVRRVVNGATVRLRGDPDMTLQSGDSVGILTRSGRSEAAALATRAPSLGEAESGRAPITR
jgi:polysaccharide export outer membrane protein